jgi:CheY-like chemotaxis protein
MRHDLCGEGKVGVSWRQRSDSDLLGLRIYCSTQRELRDFPHIIFSLGFSQWTGWRMRRPGGEAMHRILVVDDYDCMRELIKEELVQEGYAVETTAELECVPDLIRALRPDMVIIELYMQRRPRWDVLVRIKRQTPSLPVLIVTTIEGFKNDPRASVADGFVLKTVCFDGLKEKIGRLLRPKMIEDSEVAHEITFPEAAVGLSLDPR